MSLGRIAADVWARISGGQRDAGPTPPEPPRSTPVAASPRRPVDGAGEIARAREFIAGGRLSDAEACCKQVLELGNDPVGHQLLGYVAQQSGRYELAVAECHKARDAGLVDWSNDLVLGLSLRSLERHAEALDAFGRAQAAAPERSDLAELMLREALIVHGVAGADSIFRSLNSRLDQGALSKVWSKLCFEHSGQQSLDLEGIVAARQLTARDWATRRGRPVMMVEGIDTIPVGTPIVFGREHEPERSVLDSNDPYVVELRDVTIFSKSNIVLTTDGFALNEVGAHATYGRFVSHQSDRAVLAQHGDQLLLDVASFDVRPSEDAIMLSGTVSDAFGHWVPEYLPKLQFLEHHPDFDKLPIVVDEEMPQSHFDYLACIAKNRLIRMPPNVGLKFRRLLFAPPPTFFPVHLLPNNIPVRAVGPVSPRSYRFLKAGVEKSLGPRGPRHGKYFLSRSKMLWRRLTNDAEVAACLAERGYEIVQIETLTFEQQVRMFQNATHIVASNGSALQNIIFSDPAVKLLILSQVDVANWGAFCAQTGELGYQSTFLCGRSVGDSTHKHADYAIDIGELSQAIDQFD